MLRAELSQTNRIRDPLVPPAGKAWKSRSAWILARALGKLNIGISQLVPLSAMTRDADGSWRGNGRPQFLVPISPLRGWVRVRAKIRSSVSSRACLYLDTGNGFRDSEHFELGTVAGDTEIDRMVPVRKQTFSIRFDPIRLPGEFVLSEFSLEPVSSLRFNIQAVLRNLHQWLTVRGPGRPSLWRQMQLLFSGNLAGFHQLLVDGVESSTAVPDYESWKTRHKITDVSRQQMRDQCSQWHSPPKISVILPVYDVPEIYLRKCIDSVLNQIYPNWELCIADDASSKPHIKPLLQEYAAKDARIKVLHLPANGGISTASNAALALSTGDYIALLDHDDELAEQALYRFAEAIMNDPSLDMLYSDEDKLTPDGERLDPFFKPDWSPEYFLACMFTCHLGVYRAELVKKAGGWRKQFDGAQDYDLVLRLVANNPRIHHIPDVLYHWRTLPSSTASGASAKPEAHFRAQAALQNYLDLMGRKGRIEDGPASGFHRVRYEIRGNPKVSIVIPSACLPIEMSGRQTWLVHECVSSIRRLTTYKNLEIIVLDDNRMSDKLQAALKALDVRRIPFDGPFNFSSKMNLGCFAAAGEHLVMLNDDVEVITPDWIESMLEFSQWPEIGAVGAQLLFPDNTQQHTGVTVLEGSPGHPFYQFPADHPGYFFSSQVHRNWSAVTAACMMTRTEVFKSVGGFTESFPLNYNDVDYCLKVLETNRRIVCVPYAKLYHHESLTKSGTYAQELANFKKVWGKRFARDPYYNPNLNLKAGDFSIG